MALQAYVDESGSENQHNALIMSGYIATAERWGTFSDAWDSALKMKPRLVSFKMNDAVRLKNDFDRWDPKIRDERLRLLHRLIQEHAQTYVSCVVPFEGFYKALKVLHPHKIKLTPYGVALLFLMGGARKYRESLGVNESIDFIFDDQVMEKTQLLEGWDEIVSELEPEERPFVGKTPIFRNDYDVLPLQAGDMLAWLERNRWEHMNGISEAYVPPWQEPATPVDGLTFVYDEAAIARVLTIAHEKALREFGGRKP